MSMIIIEFNKDSPEIKYLLSVDTRLGDLISIVGDYLLELNEDYYSKLVQSIVGQQLSIKSKISIWTKIKEYCGNVSPVKFLNISDDILRKAGLSFAKISYIKELSMAIVSGKLDLHILKYLPDDEVINILTAVKGIGTWTAEMFLIFSLGRLDVFSQYDAGLKRAIKWLYPYHQGLSSTELVDLSNIWKPYRTIASLYLWEVINKELIYKDFNELKNRNS